MRRAVLIASCVVGVLVLAAALGAWTFYASLDPQARAEWPALAWRRPTPTPVPVPPVVHPSHAPRRPVHVKSWLPTDDVFDVATAGGRAWIATAGGLWVVPLEAVTRGPEAGVWLTAADGLPQHQVRAVVTDERGAWVASGASVARVEIGEDGPVVRAAIEPAVVTHTAPAGLDQTPAPSPIVDLALDSDGTVYVATHGEGAFTVTTCPDGLCASVLRLGRSQVAHSVSTLRRLTSIDVGSVAGEHTVVAGTTGAGVLMLRAGRFTQTAERGGVASAIVPHVAIVGGEVWAGTVGGLSRFDGKWWHDADPNGRLGIPGLGAYRERLVTVSGGTLQEMVDRRWTARATIDTVSIRSAARASAGELLLATDDGLYVTSSGRAKRVRLGGPPAPDITSLAMIEDRRNEEISVWIGAFDRGITHFDGHTFTRVETTGVDRHVNAVRVVSPVSSSRPPELWVATIGGLYRAPLFHPGGLPPSSAWTRWGDEELPSAHVNALAVDGQHVWIGTSKGLARADASASGNWSVGSAWRPFHGLPFHIVYSIAPADDGVWIGGLGGAAFFDGEHFWAYTFETGELPDPWVNAVQVVGDQVWFGTYDRGMASFDGTTWAHHLESSVTSPRSGPASGWVFPNASAVLPDGSVWFGTMGGGLVSLDESGWRSLGSADGLAGDDVTALLYDETRDVLWVGTRTGLSRLTFTPQTRESS